MVKMKELEYEYGKMMVRRKLQNGKIINYINAPRFTSQMATVIGGNTRITRKKDMEHLSGLMDADTSGNTCRMTCTGMEYTDITVEEYTMDNGNKIRKMVMDIKGGQVATNTMDNTKMMLRMEKESFKSKASYTTSNTNKTSL
jgi:predicted nucleic acid-binding Zn finger protein